LQTVEETLFANRKTEEKMLQAINQIPTPLSAWFRDNHAALPPVHVYEILVLG
jgi:hypothetical protein